MFKIHQNLLHCYGMKCVKHEHLCSRLLFMVNIASAVYYNSSHFNNQINPTPNWHDKTESLRCPSPPLHLTCMLENVIKQC